MFSINSLNKLLTIQEKDYGYINYITIQGCNCSIFPEIIFEFFNLEGLDIGHNNLSYLPDNFDKLKNLKELVLDNNEITKLPKSLIKCTNLNYISISQTNIKLLPRWLSKLNNLESFEANENIIECIKFDITKIPNVTMYHKSYSNCDNLSENCEFLQFNYLSKPLLNLPINLKKIKLVKPIESINVKVPFGCELIIE